MDVTKRINVDLVHKSNIPYFYAVQGDTARKVDFVLYANNADFAIPDGASVLVRYQKNDGTKGVYDTLPDGSKAWSISHNVVSVVLAPQMFTIAGDVLIQVSIMSGTAVLSTFAVSMVVDVDVAEGTTTSEDYKNIGEWILPEAVSAAENSKNYSDLSYNYSESAKDALADVVELKDDIINNAIEAGAAMTGRIDMSFEIGSINTSTGEDANGADYNNRVRTSPFPLISDKIMIVAPNTVQWNLIYYDADLVCLTENQSSGWFEGARTVTPPDGTAFVRMIAGNKDNTPIEDAFAFGSQIHAFIHSDFPASFYNFVVSIVGNDSDGYTATKTINDIQTATENNQICYCLWNHLYLPLILVDDAIAHFAGVVDGIEHRVEISENGVFAISDLLGGASANDFDIYIEGYPGGTITVKNNIGFSAIQEANNSGLRCVCHWQYGKERELHLPLVHEYITSSISHLYFSGIYDGYNVAKVRFSSNGSVDATLMPFAQATRFLIQRSGDNYSILNSFDGEQLENAYSNTRLSADVPSVIVCSLQVTENPLSYMELPLVSRRELSGGDIYYVFSGTGDIDGETFVFTVRMTNHSGALSSTVEQSRIPEGLYVVNMVSDEIGNYTADKSYEEVLAVHNAGERCVQCRITAGDLNYVLPLCGTTDGVLVYGGIAGIASASVYHMENGTVSVEGYTLASSTDIDTIDVLIGGDG